MIADVTDLVEGATSLKGAQLVHAISHDTNAERQAELKTKGSALNLKATIVGQESRPGTKVVVDCRYEKEAAIQLHMHRFRNTT